MADAMRLAACPGAGIHGAVFDLSAAGGEDQGLLHRAQAHAQALGDLLVAQPLQPRQQERAAYRPAAASSDQSDR